MAVQLNIDGDNYNQKPNFSLEGVKYTFHVYWNPRSGLDNLGGWYINIMSIEGNLLLTWKSSKNRALEDFFKGVLVCADTTPEKEDEDITISNFGQDRRYQIILLSEDDINGV